MSNHGQILERYTFPNWIRVVSRLALAPKLKQRKTMPSAVIPVMEFLANPEDGQGMVLLWFDNTSKVLFNLRWYS